MRLSLEAFSAALIHIIALCNLPLRRLLWQYNFSTCIAEQVWACGDLAKAANPNIAGHGH